MTRWMIYFALAAIGFGGGAAVFSVGEREPAPGEADDLKLWAARRPSLSTSTSTEGAIEDGVKRVRRSKADGLGSSITSHLTLVADTPIGELPSLLLRLERGIEFDEYRDGDSVTELACVAIVDRLLAEDVDGLLDLALSGRSRYIEKRSGSVVGGLTDVLGYESLAAKFSAGKVPAVAVALMHTLLFQEVHDDPAVGWARAIESGMVDLDDLAIFGVGQELIELALLPDIHQRLSEETIKRSFERFASLDRDAALAAFDRLGNGRNRKAAILGLADALTHQDFEQARQIAPRLGSDRERIDFYRATLRKAWEDPFAGPEWAPDLDRVNAIPEPLVHQQLLREELSTWKSKDAEAAQVWAEENGHLELFERLTAGFPVTPYSPNYFDYEPPEIPSKFNQVDQADEGKE